MREPHGFEAHLWVLGIEARAVGEGVSTASGGLRLGARRRDGSGEVWARGKSLGAARGRGGANGGGCRGGAGLGWWLRGGVELAGVQAGRRRRSAAWERGERKWTSEIDLWGLSSA